MRLHFVLLFSLGMLLSRVCLGTNFVCPKEIPIYDSGGNQIDVLNQGTEIDVNEHSNSKEMFPVLFTNSAGEMVNGYCKASDLGKTPNLAPSAPPPKKATATESESSDSFNDENWMTDAEKAMETAKDKDRMLLMDFTGSDWCGWCKKLDKEVLSTSEFKDYADKNLVLLKVDFPKQTPQSPELRKQNDALLHKYKIEGFPTIVVLDPKGNETGRIVGFGQGPENWMKDLLNLKK